MCVSFPFDLDSSADNTFSPSLFGLPFATAYASVLVDVGKAS